MGRTFDAIPDHLAHWMQEQPVWFVATAPLASDGHVNLSPKGDDTFRVLSPTEVAYLDLTGSGAETIAHLRENGRITLMFAAFEGRPTIVRLYGKGRIVLTQDAEFESLRRCFSKQRTTAQRAIVMVDLDRVSDSCGYAVPLMTYEGDRDLLVRAHERRTDEDLADYRRTRNGSSIDGLPALS